MARGRQVYISEGCINCHSQYVRPNTSDVLMWGPTQTVEELHRERPPLIGNRRQGPDLSEVGTRRSPLWLRAHFFNPSRSATPPSCRRMRISSKAPMRQRGEDLIAYLSSFAERRAPQHQLQEAAWRPTAKAVGEAKAENGARLSPTTAPPATMRTVRRVDDGKRASKESLRISPRAPSSIASISAPDAERRLQLARIIKFGIAGTDMPGHEYLPDSEVVAITLWVDRMQQQDTHTSKGSSTISTIGEQP